MPPPPNPPRPIPRPPPIPPPPPPPYPPPLPPYPPAPGPLFVPVTPGPKPAWSALSLRSLLNVQGPEKLGLSLTRGGVALLDWARTAVVVTMMSPTMTATNPQGGALHHRRCS